MTNENSYVKLHKDIVRKLCEDKLVKIREEEAARWTSAIDSFKQCRQWFKSIGFFWLKMGLTREEWKKEVINKTWLIDFRPHMWFWGEDTCHDLLRAAKDDNVDAVMYISMDDYEDITRGF